MSLTGTAQETLAIVGRGEYVAPSGKTVVIRDEIDSAVRGTALYRPDKLDALLAARERAAQARPDPGAPAAVPPRIELTIETTAQAARRLVQAERVAGVVALNFASAKNPGGGFLGGAKAQEEDLARCSALYTCQLTQPDYYAMNRACGTMLYTDHIIYSPEVPFFRDDRLDLLEQPFTVSILTVPAPNAGEAERHSARDFRAVGDVLRRRTDKLLAVAAARGHRCLVLGAWGCGVFRNDPHKVARAFKEALEGPLFAGAFDRAVFAIWERGPKRPNLRAFEERLGVSAEGA